MDLHRFEGNPNVFFEPQPHTTDFFEVLFFEEANGRIDLNGHALDVEPYSVFFISPFQKKRCEVSLEGLKGFHLVFQNDFLSDFFNDKLFIYRLQYFYNAQHPQYLRIEKDYPLIKLVLGEIVTEVNAFQKDSPHILRSLLYFSLTKLNRLYASEYQLSPETQSDTLVYRFKQLLEQHIRSAHIVQQYANWLDVSRHQLNVMVKRYFGKTPKEIIANRLLQEIKMELRYSSQTVSEIAFELSFSEPNNLTRFFTNASGLSPSEYRALYQNDRLKR